ncbi:MAG: hypothetical protein WBQ26_10070, partial [Gemmatimonadaceae bacterium]
VEPVPEAARPARRSGQSVGTVGERLTRNEAFDLVRRAVETLTTGVETVQASAVRQRAHELLGRDSESLGERNFARILQDAHDADMIDLRRHGDDYDVSRAVSAAPVAEQLAAAEVTATPAKPPAVPGLRLGLGPRGGGARGRGGKTGELPPNLLSFGVVETAPSAAVVATSAIAEAKPMAKKTRGRPKAAKIESGAPETAAESPAKKPRARRGRKPATTETAEA